MYPGFARGSENGNLLVAEPPASRPAIALPGPLRTPPGFMLSILMPVYNECATLPEVVQRVLAVHLPKELIIVDDGSTDASRDYLCGLGAGGGREVRVVRHERNRGKGAAIRTAIPLAGGTVCLIQDADLEYDPGEYPRLVQPILDGKADAVYGSRWLGGQSVPAGLHGSSVANRVLTLLSNLTTHLDLTDIETAYKVVRTDLLRSLPLISERFEIEPEITAWLARAGARVVEVPVSYHPRSYAEGKKIRWRDGVRALQSILRHRPRG